MQLHIYYIFQYSDKYIKEAEEGTREIHMPQSKNGTDIILNLLILLFSRLTSTHYAYFHYLEQQQQNNNEKNPQN